MTFEREFCNHYHASGQGLRTTLDFRNQTWSLVKQTASTVFGSHHVAALSTVHFTSLPLSFRSLRTHSCYFPQLTDEQADRQTACPWAGFTKSFCTSAEQHQIYRIVCQHVYSMLHCCTKAVYGHSWSHRAVRASGPTHMSLMLQHTFCCSVGNFLSMTKVQYCSNTLSSLTCPQRHRSDDLFLRSVCQCLIT